MTVTEMCSCCGHDSKRFFVLLSQVKSSPSKTVHSSGQAQATLGTFADAEVR